LHSTLFVCFVFAAILFCLIARPLCRYDPHLARASLRALSPPAADALACGLECLRCWALEAPWALMPAR
jgi:hypothetical protein